MGNTAAPGQQSNALFSPIYQGMDAMGIGNPQAEQAAGKSGTVQNPYAAGINGAVQNQEASSQANTAAQTQANRANQNTPWASQNWVQGPNGQWTQNTSL